MCNDDLTKKLPCFHKIICWIIKKWWFDELKKNQSQLLSTSAVWLKSVFLSFTLWLHPIWIKVKSWWQILPQNHSTCLSGPESTSNEIPPFRSKFIYSRLRDKHKATLIFEKFKKWGLKGGISIDADSGPLRYVLWCCGSICHQLFTFI